VHLSRYFKRMCFPLFCEPEIQKLIVDVRSAFLSLFFWSLFSPLPFFESSTFKTPHQHHGEFWWTIWMSRVIIFLSFIFSFSLFYFFGFYKPCDSLIRRWCSRQIQMSRIKRVRIFLLLPPPSSSCLLLFWEIHAFETFMHVQKVFFIFLSFFGWGVSFIGWESPINHTGPKRLSRTVARLLMMVEPLWALVKTLFNVCWLSCILGLGLFNLPR